MIGLDQLGERLAGGRQAKSLSQREVARRVGVSASLISQIETGKVQPSVATLMAIVSELGLSIDEMLHVGDAAPSAIGAVDPNRTAAPPEPASTSTPPPDAHGIAASTLIAAAARRTPAERTGRGSVVQCSGDRARIELSTGVTWDRLTAESDADVDFILVTYPPGASSSEGDQLLTHAGKEYWYIMSGELRVQVVFDNFLVGADDSFSFECTLPHQFRNDGDVPVHAVVTVVHAAGGVA